MFVSAAKDHADALNLLLVDSEAPIAVGKTPKQHLVAREGSTWPCPGDDGQYHLMVQTMEAWFMADQDAVAKYFGQGFSANSLPKNPDVEQIPKQDLEPSLKAAAKATKKKTYKKIRDGAKLLKAIDPSRVRQAAPHCKRLFEAIEQGITSP